MEHLSSLTEEKTGLIVNMLKEFVDLWHTKDADKFGEIFTEDAEFTDIVNQIARGKQQIIEQHRFPFETVNKIAEFKISKVYLREISDRLVLVTGDWILEKAQTPGGEPLADRSGVLQMICKEGKEKWKISLVHNTDLSRVYQKMVNTDMRFYNYSETKGVLKK